MQIISNEFHDAGQVRLKMLLGHWHGWGVNDPGVWTAHTCVVQSFDAQDVEAQLSDGWERLESWEEKCDLYWPKRHPRKTGGKE